ncbi:suppressor of fused homolog isoform X2 [Cylas formicarius]|uniref:suppressor of fused homolog isoform X2 n=1 Tax=Cylas formicarius TaxID=197179 RepID=UPI0029583C2A|nr:suppressor of fused homolog isoform X2 [Cylas formicarius]
MCEPSVLSHGPPILPPTPAGLESLYCLCRKIYPDQANPLQVTALLKYCCVPGWVVLIPWITFQCMPIQEIQMKIFLLTGIILDLHGDGRVHDVSGPNGLSGFGFELSFRLKREANEASPPTWPATLMQSLAKYVFQSGNILCSGDHVSWHCALDNSESRIQHMLMTTDVQLNTAHTPFGSVDFVQIVGICADELKAAQQWNGAGVLDILRRIPEAGGSWHITDMRRGESIFELDLNAQEEVERGFELEGSNLSGVSARCSWSDLDSSPLDMKHLKDKDCDKATDKLKSSLQQSISGSCGGLEPMEYLKKLDGIHLAFNLEAGSLLPLAIRGRVKHGRHFTFKSVLGETAITLVANSVTGTLVTGDHPFVAQGSWLQVLIPDDLAQDMAITFQALASPESLSLPKTFSWPDRHLSITIVADKL